MFSKCTRHLVVCLTLAILSQVQGRSQKYQELKPVLIKSVVSHNEPRTPYKNVDYHHGESSQEDDRTARKFYHIPAGGHQHHNYVKGPPPSHQEMEPERTQILHRPNSSGSRRSHNGYHQQHTSSSGYGQQNSNHNQDEMPNEGPIILGNKKGGKKVKYVNTNPSGSGFQGPEKPPQVYVISNGDDEEESGGGGGGVMGSMQTYFKSMTGRIRQAFQTMIGGITD